VDVGDCMLNTSLPLYLHISSIKQFF